MQLIDNKNITKPQTNLALEEFALHHLDLSDDYLLFYINEPSVIIGRHQNTHEQINADYIEQNNVHVVRRISGGGAVYHDFGNLNFSFISQADGHTFNRYDTFTKPIISLLHALGVNAELSGRNDILVDGRKISGNAQYIRGNRMFCHGTLLFNTNLENVVSALNVNPDKIQSKGIQSIRSRVANISEFLDTPLDIYQFKQAIIDHVFQGTRNVSMHKFSDMDWHSIHEYAGEKYHDWCWNYGHSPESNIQNRKRFTIGEIDARFLVKGEVIQSARFFGDFFAQNDIADLEQRFEGQRYEKASLKSLLDKVNLHSFFGEIEQEDFLNLIY